MVVPPCDIEGGRSSGWWGLTLGEGGDGEGGGGGEGLHQPADRGGIATQYDEAKVWRKGIGKCVWGYADMEFVTDARTLSV